jgi:hypothetical protein
MFLRITAHQSKLSLDKYKKTLQVASSHPDHQAKQSRTYYAAIAKNNVKPLDARITEKNNQLELEIYEPYTYQLSLNRYRNTSSLSYYYKNAFNYLYNLLGQKTHTWDTKLSISPDGRCLEYNYAKIVSSEFPLDLDGYYRAFHSTVHPWWTIGRFKYEFIFAMLCSRQDEWLPDLLYAIPQATWDAFIAKLPNQEVVSILNLAEHRHLCKAYNYAAVSNHSKLRADAISKYHFLASLLPDIEYSYSSSSIDYFTKRAVDSEDYDISQPSSKYFINHYLSRKSNHYYIDQMSTGEFVLHPSPIKFENEISPKEIFFQIDQGKSPAEILTNKFLYLTPLFLNKFSHCPQWRDLNSIGSHLILPKATNKNILDKEKLNEFIAALPSSKKSPQEFSEMIKSSRTALSKTRGDDISSRLFYQSRNQFSLFQALKRDDENLLRDYISAIVNDLIFPELMRMLLSLKPVDLVNFKIYNLVTIYDLKKVTGQFDLPKILSKLKNQFSLVLFESAQLRQLLLLQEKWHRNITVINANKPPSDFEIKWHALFEKQVIDYVSFECLTTDEQLRTEGKEMQHCVGGYSSQCMLGRHHIIAINTLAGERSTLELSSRSDNKDAFGIMQNLSTRNSDPCKKITKATDKLLYQLNNSKIALNPNRGEIVRPGKPAVRLPAHAYYPYDFFNKETQEEIYLAYKNAKTLPAILLANNFDGMLAKSGMDKMILDVISELSSLKDYYRENNDHHGRKKWGFC